MTPFEFGILLHYYSMGNDHEIVFRNPPIWPETRRKFLDLELLERMSEDSRTSYRLTERGHVFIAAALNTRLPVKKWAMPE